ncbi:MAG: TAXI family TRAP transporter solute-binding subunit, partial [Bacteroidales bacterium]|nr:TAXI family TRAP transporter solute-binding subunit [Bacteroidales bacterium]
MIKKIYWFFIFTLILSTLFSCNQDHKKLRLAASSENTSSHTAGLVISNEIKNKTDFEFYLIDSCRGSFDNARSILDNKADFAILQNTLNYHEHDYSEEDINNSIRTVLPLYSQILFVIYHDSIHNNDIKKLFLDKRIGLGPKGEATDWLVTLILDYFGIHPNDYIPVYTDYPENIVNDKIDISCSVTSFNNQRIIDLMSQPNLRLFSFDDLSNVEIHGSTINSLSLRNTTLSPKIIPKHTYYSKPQTPVLTVSTNAVLVCRSDMDDGIIYEITQSLINHKSLIVNSNPIFRIINENFNTNELRFPIHPGVQMYLDRAKPSFLEKYAEVMALLLTITVLLFGLITSIGNWQKLRKKDRIDIYYQKVLDLDKVINNTSSSEELIKIEKELLNIRDEAFKLLINEKLSADESFNIFLRIMESCIQKT